MNSAVKFFMAQQKLTVVLLALSLIWLLTFSRGLWAAADVWWTSEIFHHCFFVLPISAWLIYLKRDELLAVEKNVNYFALPLIFALLFLQVFGVAGDIKLFQYIATFAIIPCLILFFIGLKACWIILFPLFFLIFAIPVGDELIPTLQFITADLSVYFLNFSGITIFRDGLYIEIPNGKFFVAEACSGISFLIVSVVFSSLYSYLYIKDPMKKLLFVFLAFAVPIVANALRVMGIVIIGDVWGMEYASGTDHLIYGGVFYCFVLFMLIMIGEKLKNKYIQYPSDPAPQSISNIGISKINLIVAIMLLAFIWQSRINKQLLDSVDNEISPALIKHIKQAQVSSRPDVGELTSKIGGKLKSDENIEVFIKYFSHPEQAFSSKQQIYSRKLWRAIKTDKVVLSQEFANGFFRQQVLQNAYNQSLNFISLYKINNKIFANKLSANLYYAWLKITQPNVKVVLITLMAKAEINPKELSTLINQVDETK